MSKRVITWREYKGICAGDICIECVRNKHICSNFKELPSVNDEIIKVLKEILKKGLLLSGCDCGCGINSKIIEAKIKELEAEDEAK